MNPSMSGGDVGSGGGAELALETQLLLQEVTQAKQFEVNVDETGPVLSEYEAAKQALVDKLRRKKEQNRQQLQQLQQKRYGFSASNSAATAPTTSSMPSKPGSRLTPVKHKQLPKLPVAAGTPASTRKKHDLLTALRQKAIKQGAQEMAKLFGYSSYEEQIKHLNKIEKMKILQSERQEKINEEVQAVAADTMDKSEEDVEVAEDEDVDMTSNAEVDGETDPPQNPRSDAITSSAGPDAAASSSARASDAELEGDRDVVSTEPVSENYEETQDLDAIEAQQAVQNSPSFKDVASRIPRSPTEFENASARTRSPRRRQMKTQEAVEEDGNDADSEHDGDEENNDDIAGDTQEGTTEASKRNKDRAAAFRQLLQEEAAQNRQRRRLRKAGEFVESEAEEEEEEDVLKIGGLGDFGFGVPQAASKESKEAEEERNALKLREDDLHGIVDDLSDDERDQQHDLDEIFRRETEEQDRMQVKEVMRNVKEGFGRNRRAFSSGLDGGAGARGRFNLNELVAADGDKSEAARLGLLESDEELNDDDDDDDDEKKDDVGEGENEEEDEEAEMERMLRERFLNQPQIYITSSESESEDEGEKKKTNDDNAEEAESDEERERQQMKLFSERARINRRMQRMKEMQRQVNPESEKHPSAASLPNLLLEEDEDSQSLLKVLNRTDVATNSEQHTSKPLAQPVPRTVPVHRPNGRPQIGRFNSFGMGSSRSSSSFSRVADKCKLFTAGSNTSTAKGFVFTSAFGADKADEKNDECSENSENAPAPVALGKSKSWGGSSRASLARKRPFAASNGSSGDAKKPKSSFFSMLSSYQCVSQNEAI